jgi:hypothetical protein
MIMQMEKLTKQQEQFLDKTVGISPDVFKSMSYDELDALADDKLLWMECDGVDDSLPNGITENGKLAAGLIDIIYGPYDEDEDEEDMQGEMKAASA